MHITHSKAPNQTPFSLEPYTTVIGLSIDDPTERYVLPQDESYDPGSIELYDSEADRFRLNTGFGIRVNLGQNSIQYLHQHVSYPILNITRLAGKKLSNFLHPAELIPFYVIGFFYVLFLVFLVFQKIQSPLETKIIFISIFTLIILRLLLYYFRRGNDSKAIERYLENNDGIFIFLLDIIKFSFFPYALLSPFGLEPRNLSNFIFSMSIILFLNTLNTKFLYLSTLSILSSVTQGIFLSIPVLIFLFFINLKNKKFIKFAIRYFLLLFLLSFTSISINHSLHSSTIFSLFFSCLGLIFIYYQRNSHFNATPADALYLILILLLSTVFLFIYEFLIRINIQPLASEFGYAFLLRSVQVEGWDRLLPVVGFIVLSTLIIKTYDISGLKIRVLYDK